MFAEVINWLSVGTIRKSVKKNESLVILTIENSSREIQLTQFRHVISKWVFAIRWPLRTKNGHLYSIFIFVDRYKDKNFVSPATQESSSVYDVNVNIGEMS